MISQGDLLELGLPQKVMHTVRREVEQRKDAEFATKVCKEAIGLPEGLNTIKYLNAQIFQSKVRTKTKTNGITDRHKRPELNEWPWIIQRDEFNMRQTVHSL